MFQKLSKEEPLNLLSAHDQLLMNTPKNNPLIITRNPGKQQVFPTQPNLEEDEQIQSTLQIYQSNQEPSKASSKHNSQLSSVITHKPKVSNGQQMFKTKQPSLMH